jgi:hypothetical protein
MMRALGLVILCGLTGGVSTLLAQDELAARVRDEVLDQQKPVLVNVSLHGLTTLQFPGKIDALEGDGFTSKPGEEAGDFAITPGINWVSVKSLRPGAQQNLSVVIKGKVYEIFVKTAQANDFSVLFRFADQGSKTLAPPPSNRKSLTPARVLSMLDKLKGYPVFSAAAPAMYIDTEINEPKSPRGTEDGDKLRTQIVRVIRDQQLNVLGFEVHLLNKTDGDLMYDPNSLAVEVGGTEMHKAIVADGAGKIPAHAEQSAYFVVPGSLNSGTGDLGVDNDFSLWVATK